MPQDLRRHCGHQREAHGGHARRAGTPEYTPAPPGGLGALGVLLTLGVLATASGTIDGAPAPFARYRPVSVVPAALVGPGEYVLHWGGSRYAMTLTAGGGYSSVGDSVAGWRGSWSYSAYQKTLVIHETLDGEEWVLWLIDMKADRTGRTWCGTAVRLEPVGRPP